MERKSPSPTDRRVLRTRRTLREALVALILERGWEEVSVQDVCERADVGRSTFYTHFTDKEDLLVSGFQDLKKALRGSLLAHAAVPERPLGFVRGLAEHAHEQQRLFRAVVGKRSGHVVQKRFRQLVLELVREDLAGLARPADGPAFEGTVRYVAGALIELLTWWIDGRNSMRPDEVDALFQRLTAPVLSSIGKR